MRFVRLIPLFFPALLAAQAKTPSPAEQIALAVLPLPQEFRADATVLGYNDAGKLVPLRATKGAMICLADDPADDKFHAACYARGIEPFMLRGRQLRAAGTKGAEVDSVRFREIRTGKLHMPKQAALWQLNGPMTAVDVAAGKISAEVKALYVIYMPYATSASTGIPAAPAKGMPWLMLPGTPKAHIMLTPDM
jgi:hypothetical protein